MYAWNILPGPPFQISNYATGLVLNPAPGVGGLTREKIAG